MPELPEVETIKLGLQKKIVGLKIKAVEVLSPKSLIGEPKILGGKKVLNVWRKAKYLGIDLNGDLTLLFHLKMTGQIIYVPNDNRSTINDKRFIGGHPTPDMRDEMPNAHTRVIFTFSDGSKLYFNDQRKFGWVKVIENLKSKIENSLNNLGPEPLNRTFKWEILKQNLFKHRSMPVKVALMDQQVVSGVGNIYANEACFNAKLDPRIKVSQLTDQDMKSLHRGVLKALRDGIKFGGSSKAHFVDAQGHKGYFLDYAFVYGRDKHKCKKCGTEIKKIQLGGRGTYFCPKCQR